MPTGNKDQLWRLVKSLTKAEKRNFQLFANRTGGDGLSKFVQLFNVLDRQSIYDEEQLLSKLPGVRKQHLSNLKRNLYRQILASLRIIHIRKQIDIEIREQIDFARILYGKGLYLESLKILERIKDVAVEHHQDVQHLEILEFQKLIESRHITRSRQTDDRMDRLLYDSAVRSQITLATSELFNLNIQMHGYYIEHGHARNAQEREQVVKVWQEHQPRSQASLHSDTFYEKAHWFQARMWYYNTLLEWPAATENAQALLNLFGTNRKMTVKDPDLYMRSLYYCLVFDYIQLRKSEFAKKLRHFEKFVAEQWSNFNPNSRYIAFVYLRLSRLNACFLDADYRRAREVRTEIEKGFAEYQDGIDENRQLLFLYKFAYIDFAEGRYREALDFLNEIINRKSALLNDELQINTRLLHLICHLELENFSLVEYHSTNLQRWLHRSRDTSQTHQAMVSLLRKLARTLPEEQADHYHHTLAQLRQLAEQEPFEYKAERYLDAIGWIEAKLHHADTLARQLAKEQGE
jgi:hypothetical protein